MFTEGRKGAPLLHQPASSLYPAASTPRAAPILLLDELARSCRESMLIPLEQTARARSDREQSPDAVDLLAGKDLLRRGIGDSHWPLSLEPAPYPLDASDRLAVRAAS